MDIKELKEKVKDLSLLYVEDEDEIRAETGRFFKKFFDDISLASNGEEAWEMFSRRNYDLVISDLKMPKMGGNELLQKVKQSRPETKTVMMSGSSSSDMEIKEENVDITVFKPMDIKVFIKLVESFYSNRL